LFSTHTGEAPGFNLPDFCYVIGAANRPFFNAFYRQLVQNGYEAQNSKSYSWKLDFFKNNKYTYHFCMLQYDDFHLRLKLDHVSSYTDFLATCPEQIQQAFVEHPPCLRCREVCGSRVEYEFCGAHHEMCTCQVFQFHHPKVEEIDTYLKLIELEDQAKLAIKEKALTAGG
jgi:hypothetical protein